ncbi:hypothetical protein HCN44_002152 [Aphidius gifuensis]|uniref:protein-tyrosine-phosphatase n=2 Tax=Aphidius gifuensis TaxID=684658 RepID=A0A834Y231_APHGI|nr:hypothetical protein HCN44_002152 [Aphidius gifuensis]
MSLYQSLQFIYLFGLIILVSGNIPELKNNEETNETTISQINYTTTTTTLVENNTESSTTPSSATTIIPNKNDTESEEVPLIDDNEFLTEILKKPTTTKFPNVVPMTPLPHTVIFTREFDIDTIPMCVHKSPSNESKIIDKNKKLPFESDSVGSAKTNNGKPLENVIDLGVIGATESSLTVSWKAPNSTVKVQYYLVEWFRSNIIVDSCKCFNDSLEYTITNLETCTNYGVHVTPYIGGSLHSSRAVSETTSLKVGNTSLSLTVSENSSDWLKISWNLPSTDCVLKYTVTYCNLTICTSADSNTTTYNATNLLPCTEYNFTVGVHGKSGEFDKTTINTTTDFLLPSIPEIAWTISDKKSLEIFWSLPMSSTCVLEYEVVLAKYGKTITERIKNNQIKINELGYCDSYRVTITPLHIYGKSQSAIIEKSNTTFPDIFIPPKALFLPLSTKNSIKISWIITTNDENNCQEVDVFASCNVTRILGVGYNGTDGETSVTIPIGTTNHHVVTTIDNLTPYTEYICHSFANNSQGSSKQSEPQLATTQQDFPWSPTITQENVTNTEFKLVWKAPVYIPGNLSSYEISIDCQYMFYQPTFCKERDCIADPIKNIEGSEISFIYTSAVPYTNYSIKIKAETKVGWGNYSDIINFVTLSGAPGPVVDLIFYTKNNIHDFNSLDAYLSWSRPCFMHGKEIEYYNITVIGERKNYENHYFTFIYEDNYCQNDQCLKQFKYDTNLREEYSYHFYVAARVKEFNGLGETSIKTTVYPAGIPPEPDANYTSQITIDPYLARKTTNTATILLPLFPDNAGTIRCYAIMVARMGFINSSYGRIDLNNGEWPFAATWFESKHENFEIPYQAAKICNNSYSSFIVDYGTLKAVKFVLGEDYEICPSLSSNRDERSFCNGPLNPDTWYDVRIRAFTNGGYRDSKIFTVKTNNEFSVVLTILIIFGILCVGVLVTMMLLIRKCSFQNLIRRLRHSDMQGSPVPTPFSKRKFITHCQQLADNPGKLSNEFQLLQTLSVDLQMPTNAACLQANRKKNRYTDILPYDFSRVKLKSIDNDPNSDYINASFIKGFSGNQEYIACQGPKEETTYDFWRMIDEKDVKVIVMLTQLIENNKEKCHQYFPTIRETFTFENISIRCSMELDYRPYTQRTFILQKEDNKKKTIIHLHFKDWLDHDVPEDFDLMINFCNIMRRHMTASPGLAVIHCSAGIGRTGTLIAIDILLQNIKENRKLDVFGTVYRLRHHRINMVQRESQYAYIYNCIRQVLKNPYFSKNYKPPSVDPENNTNNMTTGTSETNLVSSIETLRKSSLSTSIDSAEQLFNSSSSISSKESKNCFTLQNLHGSKSTSAIYTKPTDNTLVRYNTLNNPINELDKNQESTQSKVDETDYNSSFRSIYETIMFTNTSRIDDTTKEEDSSATEKLLDTSL